VTRNEIRIGQRVKTLREFNGVPKGTEGVIDEDYGTGIMIAWDLPESRLPQAYGAYDGRPMIMTGILRDGFDKVTELEFLEVVNGK